MKKRGISALSLGAALFLLCGCGGNTPALNLSANWYSNTTNETLAGTYERLEYAITLTSDEEDYGVRYEDGATFVTELSSEHNETFGTVYKLTSTRDIAGKYYLGGTESERFEDHTHSEVLFTSAKDGLRPIRSKVEMRTSVPVASPTAERMFDSYHYEYTTEYDESLSNAHFVLQYYDKDGNPADKIDENIKLGEPGSYLDNEQIVFALRGVSFSGSINFHSLDPQTRKNVSVAITQTPAAVKRSLSCEIDGEKKNDTIDAWQVSLAYGSAQPGPSRNLIYAAKGDATNNTFRNVLIYFDYSVQRLGKMCYTLTRATFTTN